MACNKCGSCCKSLVFEIPNLSEKRIQLEYYKAHGCKIENNTVIVPMKCPHLTEENLCDIHEKKPFLCKSWNGEKREGFWIPPECTNK